MSRLFFAVVVAASLATLAVAPVGVVGQADNTTATETGETVAIQLDNSTRITDWGYVNGSWSITLESDRPQLLTVTDSAAAMQAWEDADGKTSADLNPERYSLSSGETTVRYPGSTFDGQAAITVATTDGMRFLATDGIQRGRDPVPWGTAIGVIAIAGIGSAYVSHRRVRSKYEERDREIERFI